MHWKSFYTHVFIEIKITGIVNNNHKLFFFSVFYKTSYGFEWTRFYICKTFCTLISASENMSGGISLVQCVPKRLFHFIKYLPYLVLAGGLNCLALKGLNSYIELPRTGIFLMA